MRSARSNLSLKTSAWLVTLSRPLFCIAPNFYGRIIGKKSGRWPRGRPDPMAVNVGLIPTTNRRSKLATVEPFSTGLTVVVAVLLWARLLHR